MSLIPCPGCGRQVAPNAAACPGCGAPVRRASSPGSWKALGFLLIVVAMLYGGIKAAEHDMGGIQIATWLGIAGFVLFLVGRFKQ